MWWVTRGLGSRTPEDSIASTRSRWPITLACPVRQLSALIHTTPMWIKALNWRTGHANVIGHLDRVLAMLSSGVLDPSPLVTHHMSLDEAPEAYAIYDRREALKIVLRP